MDTQFRMHPQIARFPAEEFYDKKLVNSPLMSFEPPPWPLKQHVTFLNVDGREEGQASKFNKQEADVVMEVLDKLCCPKGGLRQSDIGMKCCVQLFELPYHVFQ